MKNLLAVTLLLMTNLTLFSQDKPKGLSVKDKAPDFTAKDQSGKTINLKSQLNKSSVVMVFYRGEWCPFCNKELKALEDSLKFITAKGAVVLAVSPEKPENIAKTVEKTKASYSILYDEGLKIMKSYGVSFKVDSLTIVKYKTYGIDFNMANGEVNGANLPIPAVYIIDKKGIITYRYFDADYRKRPTVKELLSHL
jgi:peroxiredoxin